MWQLYTIAHISLHIVVAQRTEKSVDETFILKNAQTLLA